MLQLHYRPLTEYCVYPNDANERYPFGVAEGAINKLPNLFRNFQAKLSLVDGSLESPVMAPKKRRYTVSGILKLSGKNTEGYGGSFFLSSSYPFFI